jgi:hypothetical protein
LNEVKPIVCWGNHRKVMGFAALFPSYSELSQYQTTGLTFAPLNRRFRLTAVGWVERSETHHLLPRHAHAVTNYRRNFICNGSFSFTANLAERRLRLLVDNIVSAKDDGFRCCSIHPTR